MNINQKNIIQKSNFIFRTYVIVMFIFSIIGENFNKIKLAITTQYKFFKPV